MKLIKSLYDYVLRTYYGIVSCLLLFILLFLGIIISKVALVDPVYSQTSIIKDPLRKGHCTLNLSTRDTDRGPIIYHSP